MTLNRDIEEEFVPLAADFGIAIQPWSSLAFGLLTGKYDRRAVEAAASRDGGLPREAASADTERPGDDKWLDGTNPFGDSLFTERNWQIVDVVQRVARECSQSAASVALGWVMQRPGVHATLMGASRVEQVRENMAALELRLSAAHLAVLDEASAQVQKMLYGLFAPPLRQHAVFGGSAVRSWAE